MKRNAFFQVDQQKLMETALGTQYPDLVIANTDLVNVYTREICKNVSISIKGQRIAYIGDGNDFCHGPKTSVVDAKGKIAIPGLIDGHTHLAWLMPPHTFLPYAAKGGTTTIITETMEMYPVGGKAAVEDFLESLGNQPIKCLATAPAMGAISKDIMGIHMEDLQAILQRGDVVGLGESYWQNVLQYPERFLPGFNQTLQMGGKTLEGHSAGASARKLAAYLCLGISSCHEPITMDQVVERLRSGIHVMIREGGIRSDLDAMGGILNKGLDLRYLCLVSDGISPQSLKQDGYMERIVQKAVDIGFAPVDAIRMATLNVAEHFHLSGHIGGIAPGRYADILLLDDLCRIVPDTVISNGKVITKKGALNVSSRIHSFSSESLDSIKLRRTLTAEDFTVPAQGCNGSSQQVRIIDMVTDLVTAERHVHLDIREGQLKAAPEKDILKISAIDRSREDGKQFNGFISGFGIRECAFACTGAWDSANIVVIGVDGESMARAVNRIKTLGGGIVVWGENGISAELALPHYGLFADETMDSIIHKLNLIYKTIQGLGCALPNPILTLRTLTGAAIPYFRISEQGLVHLKEGKTVPLAVDEMTDDKKNRELQG